MLIDVTDSRHDDSRKRKHRASGSALSRSLLVGSSAHVGTGGETAVVTEGALRMGIAIREIFSDLEFSVGIVEGLHGRRAILISPSQITESSVAALEVGEIRDKYSATRERLEFRLWQAFDAEPLEDGMDHPADQLLADSLAQISSPELFEWIGDWCTDASNATFAASVFQCLARQENPGTAAWRAALVQRGLASREVEIRDAAACAADAWQDAEMVPILEKHVEPVRWLAAFIREVLAERS